MRSAAAWALAAVLAAPALLALAVPGVDFDAIRCAIKCGHPVRAGAVCCPTDGDASWRTCPANDQALLGYAPAAVGVLTAVFRLPIPSESAPLLPARTPAPRTAPRPPLDHVPLALS
jgi:hypothetical protein